MRIKSNESLFNRWRRLGSRISNQASIVQNDMEVSEEEIAEWCDILLQLYEKLEQLQIDTLSYIRSDL